MRVGMGYDVHKLVDGRDLILGGVKIPYEKGLLGHSDADVLLHAVMDALLGAAALGDIGKHFPDTDPAYEGASSIKLLEEVGKLIDEKLYVIGNIDATIIAQRPKMAPHIEQMRKNVAEALHIEVEQVNIKATTEEGLGFTGTGEGISSQAIASLDTIANYSYRVGPAEGGQIRNLLGRKIKMKIRKLETGEKLNTRKLYEEVFSEDSKDFVDYYYEEKVKDNQIYVVEEDGEIQAMLHLNPYELAVNGSRKDVNYIVAVATRKSYRKRGFMAGMLKQALNDMYADGETFTFLMPASESIYLPFDFRTVYEQNRAYYDPEAEVEEGTDVTDASVEDAEKMAVYMEGRLSQSYQVYAKRNTAYYELLIKEYASDGGTLKIYKKEGAVTDIKIAAEAEEVDGEKPKIMIRIIDVRRMLMSLRLKTFMGTCFTVTDPVIKENNRCVMITGTEFSGVMLMDGKPENSEGTLTVAALTSLVFGVKTAEEICADGDAVMSDRMKEELDKIIPLSQIYLNETV